jgi:broad specificity phosphatase PhoE
MNLWQKTIKNSANSLITKRVVFFAPLTAEGLEQARSVKKAQEEKRSDRDAVRT